MYNSSAFQCLILSQEKCATVALTVRITNLVLSTVTISLLLYLLLVLKRKAWNSPVKRLTLILTTCICFCILVDPLVQLFRLHKVFKVFTVFTQFVFFLYMFMLLTILIFQIGAAIVPGEWKHKIKPKVPRGVARICIRGVLRVSI